MICNGCGYDWTGFEVCNQLSKIDKCPECPEAGVEGYDPRRSSSEDSAASDG